MAWNKLPKNFGSTVPHLDEHDREAERQGNARLTFVKEFSPSNAPKGRRMQKMDLKNGRGAAIVGCKRVINFTKDHAAAVARIGVRAA